MEKHLFVSKYQSIIVVIGYQNESMSVGHRLTLMIRHQSC